MNISDYIWDVGLVLATASIAVVYRKIIRPFLFRKGARQFFNFPPSSEVIMIIPTISNPDFLDTEMIDETTPLESVYVTGNLNSFISRLLGRTGKLQIDLSIMCSPKTLEENLILIGGPNHNQCTASFLNSFESPLKFEGNKLISKLSGKEYEAVIEGDKIIEDYTMVISQSNPWNKKKHLVLLAACRGYGAIAASEFLCDDGIEKILAKSDARGAASNSIFAVISNRVNHFSNGHFKVISTKVEEVHFDAN